MYIYQTPEVTIFVYLKVAMSPGGGTFGGFMSPRITSPLHPSGAGRSGGGGGGGGGGGRGRGRGGAGIRRDRELIGQTIKITGGPYKGDYHIA
jgi:transcription elongation factor SPT5